MPNSSDVIFKIDSKGKVRQWQYVVDGSTWWTVAGVQGGKLVTSKPTQSIAASRDTAEEQAQFEAEAQMVLKLKGGYFRTLEEAKQPKVFRCMTAKKYLKEVTPPFPFNMQPKLDGLRANMSEEEGVLSRRREPFYTCDHVLEGLNPFFTRWPGAISDGELYNHEYHDNFNKISSLIKKKKPTAEHLAEAREKVQYHMYDAFFPDEPDLPFEERMRRILECFEEHPSIYVWPVATYWNVTDKEMVDRIYGEIMEDKYEGAMIRVPGSAYEPDRRSEYLLKHKSFEDAEFEVEGLEEGVGNWAGAVKRALLKLPNGKRFKAGVAGDRPFLTAMYEKVKTGWLPKEATVRYPNLTPDGIPRFGVVHAFHENRRDD